MYYYLKQHPDIFLSDVRKELNHFIAMVWYNAPFETYASYFQEWADQKAVGDISPNYMFYYNQTVALIAQHLPNAKLVFSLRHPVDRAYSSYCYTLRTGREWLTFEQAMYYKLRGRNIYDYRSSSTYSPALSAFLEHFPRDQVYFMVFDDLIADPQNTLAQLCVFLEVDSAFEFEVSQRMAEQRTNTAQYPRLPRLQRLLAYITHVLPQKWGFSHVLKPLRNRSITLPSVSDYPPLSDHLYNRFTKEFTDDINATSAIIGRDLSVVFTPRIR